MLAGIILNYNTPELTDAIYEQLAKYKCDDFELWVHDNGSDENKTSKYSTSWTKDNYRIAGGWNRAVKNTIGWCKFHKFKAKYLWLITNDTQWEVGEPLRLVNIMEQNPQIGMLHPSLTLDSPTGWRNMLHQPARILSYEWMIDIIAPVIRADVWKMVGGFDENFSRGWGMDWDFCYKMYKKGYVGAVDHQTQMRHLLGGTYRSGKADEPDDIRTVKAEEEAEKYLSAKHGGNWREDIRIHNQRKIDKYLGL